MLFEKERTREYWESLKSNTILIPLIDLIKKDYDELMGECFTVLSYSKYKLYFETGDRKVFEDAYFARRALLVRAMLLSLLYPESDEYINTFQDMAWDICNEYTWVIPAHSFNHKVDLFSSETALVLTEGVAFLSDRIDNRIKDRIYNTVKSRVIDVYNDNVFDWEKYTSNWTAVCTHNVGLTMMYAYNDDFEKNQDRIIKSMDVFLDGFSDEGVCFEGPGYWGYGFGCFVWLADAIRRYTNGTVDLLRGEKAKRISGYPQYVSLCGGATISFSDSPQKSGFGPLLINYLYDYYNGELSSVDCTYTGIKTNKQNSQFSYIKYFVFSKYLEVKREDDTKKKDYFLPDAGYMIINKKDYSFAVKAGNNAELHNHNDVGSFIFADTDGQAFCDLGHGFYSADYFGEKRYEILCNSSLGHSVPIVNGKGQVSGKEHCGSISYENGAVTVDFSKAYSVLELNRLTRTVTSNENGIILADSYCGEIEKFVERFVTQREPEIIGETVVIGKTAIKFDGSKLNPEISVATHKNHNGIDEKVYLIDFALPKEENIATFALTAKE